MPETQLTAPWSQDQVDSLNAYQESSAFHPFTCGACDDREGLTATTEGWRCKSCDYTQNWTHSFMADWSWVGGWLMKRPRHDRAAIYKIFQAIKAVKHGEGRREEEASGG